MRKTPIILASLVVGLVSMSAAPSASAAQESAQFSSFNAGVAVSGSASTTATASTTWFEIDFPRALVTAQVWAGTGGYVCNRFVPMYGS